MSKGCHQVNKKITANLFLELSDHKKKKKHQDHEEKCQEYINSLKRERSVVSRLNGWKYPTWQISRPLFSKRAH